MLFYHSDQKENFWDESLCWEMKRLGTPLKSLFRPKHQVELCDMAGRRWEGAGCVQEQGCVQEC